MWDTTTQRSRRRLQLMLSVRCVRMVSWQQKLFITTDAHTTPLVAASGITFKDFHTCVAPYREGGHVWTSALVRLISSRSNLCRYPLCTPSRAQLLTGRLAPRTGVRTNFSPESLHGLPTTEHTIAELLKPAGYDTVQLGKVCVALCCCHSPRWALCSPPLPSPISGIWVLIRATTRRTAALTSLSRFRTAWTWGVWDLKGDPITISRNHLPAPRVPTRTQTQVVRLLWPSTTPLSTVATPLRPTATSRSRSSRSLKWTSTATITNT